MCDRVAVLDQGRLAQVGTPREVYERPETPFVARFVGRINELAAGAGRPAAAGSRRMVRPHRVTVSAARSGTVTASGRQQVDGVVTRKTFVGHFVQLAAITPEGVIVAERSATGTEWDQLRVGDQVTLSWADDDTLVFRDTGAAE